MPDDPAPHGYRTLYCDRCGLQINVPIHCASRTCVPCTKARAYRIYRRALWIISHTHTTPTYRWRHITLTVPNTLLLRHAVDHLIASFRRLRQTDGWKRTQQYGFYVLEISKPGPEWHPHLHVITYGRFYHWQKILRDWQRASGTGKHIWVNGIRRGTAIAGYIAKYASKTPDLSPADAATADRYTRDRRMFSPFGSYRLVLANHPMPKFRRVCPNCGRSAWVPDFIIDQRKRLASALG